MKSILFVLIFLFPITVRGQLGGHGRLISDVLDPTAINTSTFYSIQYKDIAGSPYVEDQSLLGTIILKDGTPVEDLMLRYNGYEDAVLYQMDGEKAAMIDPELISGFSYNKGGDKINYVSTILFDGDKNFFEVIYEGEVSLYVLHKITISKKTDNTGGYGSQDLHGTAFKLSDKYLFLNEGGESKEVKLTKKSLIEAMIDHSTEMQKFIKKEKLKIKDREDLVKFFVYYDSL